jgi:PilZ domain
MKKRPLEPTSPPPEPILRQLRVPMIRKATLRHGGKDEVTMVIDIGMRGVFVERDEPLPTDTPVEVTFLLPENSLPIVAGSRVAWWHPSEKALPNKTLPGGLGLEFVGISEEDLRKVREHVVRHCQRHPKARAFNPTWPVGIDQHREGSG